MASLFERRFVFLSPEDKGYEVAVGKIPKGHIEIERKDDRLSFKVFVENLKEMGYQVQLFTLGGRYVILDEIYVGRSGKQEGEYTTNSFDVLSSGISWQEFDVIVIRPLGEEHSRKVALVTWLNNKNGARGQIPYIIDENEQEKQEVFREESQFTSELDNNQKIEEPQKIEEQIGEPQKTEEQIEEPQEIGEPQKIEEQTEEPSKEDKVNVEQQKDQYLGAEDYWVDFEEDNEEGRSEQEIEKQIEPEVPYYYMNHNIEKIEKILLEAKPFNPPIKDHKWWKIVEEQKDLEGFYLYYNGSFVNIKYPYMKYRNIGEIYIKKYNYMIFGIVFDKSIEKKPSYYVYGIPGRLCAQEQPFQGNTGFLYWHPAEGNNIEKGAMGYWLLYVDAHSGIIAIPKRPTIAPICDK